MKRSAWVLAVVAFILTGCGDRQQIQNLPHVDQAVQEATVDMVTDSVVEPSVQSKQPMKLRNWVIQQFGNNGMHKK